MARIDYDEDDLPEPQSRPPVWRRRLVTWTLAAIGLGLGFLIPYTLYLNEQVSERFGQLRWQLPTRVYARPLRLAPGVALDAHSAFTSFYKSNRWKEIPARAGAFEQSGVFA